MGVELSVLFSGSPCCDCSTSSASAFCASAEIRNLFWSWQLELSCVVPVVDQVPQILVPSLHVDQIMPCKHALICFIWLEPQFHARHALLNQGNLSSSHRPSYVRRSLLHFWCVKAHDMIALDSPFSHRAAFPKGYASVHTPGCPFVRMSSAKNGDTFPIEGV